MLSQKSLGLNPPHPPDSKSFDTSTCKSASGRARLIYQTQPYRPFLPIQPTGYHPASALDFPQSYVCYSPIYPPYDLESIHSFKSTLDIPLPAANPARSPSSPKGFSAYGSPHAWHQPYPIQLNPTPTHRFKSHPLTQPCSKIAPPKTTQERGNPSKRVRISSTPFFKFEATAQHPPDLPSAPSPESSGSIKRPAHPHTPMPSHSLHIKRISGIFARPSPQTTPLRLQVTTGPPESSSEAPTANRSPLQVTNRAPLDSPPSRDSLQFFIG